MAAKNDAFAQAQAAKIADLEAKLAAAQANNGGGGTLSARIGPSGAVCVYGLNVRRPVSLYGNQWDRLLGGLLGAGWQASVTTEGAFGEAFCSLVNDSMAGPEKADGRPAGNAAHQQRIRDAEARQAARARA